ncbi:hypothetical protein [Congregicoccus parvus]|uniref:hypothetical protein n=1 Tax=Congregicoccus parvus TaxID=3081749 RepID=UPI003FA5ABCD
MNAATTLPAPAPTTTPTLIALAPHVRVPRSVSTAAAAPKPPRALALPLPAYMFCECVPTGGGEFRLRPIHDEWVTLGRSTLKALGLEGHSRTLARLAQAGFVQTRKLSPGVLQLHLPSWVAHCTAVEADPWFWDDADRRARWRKAIE